MEIFHLRGQTNVEICKSIVLKYPFKQLFCEFIHMLYQMYHADYCLKHIKKI